METFLELSKTEFISILQESKILDESKIEADPAWN